VSLPDELEVSDPLLAPELPESLLPEPLLPESLLPESLLPEPLESGLDELEEVLGVSLLPAVSLLLADSLLSLLEASAPLLRP
jgi:hypothetical protein